MIVPDEMLKIFDDTTHVVGTLLALLGGHRCAVKFLTDFDWTEKVDRKGCAPAGVDSNGWRVGRLEAKLKLCGCGRKESCSVPRVTQD